MLDGKDEWPKKKSSTMSHVAENLQFNIKRQSAKIGSEARRHSHVDRENGLRKFQTGLTGRDLALM